jgi:hypothetical protein
VADHTVAFLSLFLAPSGDAQKKKKTVIALDPSYCLGNVLPPCTVNMFCCLFRIVL